MAARQTNVAVLGPGRGIGQPLSLPLKTDPLVTSLSLYDIRGAPSIAADVSHVDVNGYPAYKLDEAFDGVQVAVIPAWPMSVPSSAYICQPETLGNEFSILTDFLETLDEGSFFTTSPATGITWASEENLNSHSRAVALALDDHELPVRMQTALTITELAIVHDSVRDAVSPQVGKVVQDLLKLSDETDLDILNHSMEAMVDPFQTELLPVASQLTARLCEFYLRLAREGLAQQNETIPDSIDVGSLVTDGDDDKVYGAMGVAKPIGTVCAGCLVQ
ncbi:hypothetical protein CY34DRAFT_18881 [Suillus luteus UH-Slu-Lm8-n1]|uniref:malate dehydrogenase n=1 Tax=Suillus luteus UH-Slu-Lm8-n1 TaxID=930992 RepID=A0A0D0AEK2_9AGAM|nr:hypothetical protein CY34DRAFT_18881 [Suillus luteus UH-Slu-Lm8-n1]